MHADPAARVAAIDWGDAAAALNAGGVAPLGPLLTPDERALLRAAYADAARFRSRVVMQRHGYGSGEYQYFAEPLPELVAALRSALYPPLARIADGWAATLGEATRYPPDFAVFRQACHAAGQTKPTPLLLRYGPGDYNCLHQDLYGALHFPIQVVILLSEPETDFTGGEFVVTEQRPRMQSRVEVVPLRAGEATAFAVNRRPAAGSRGPYRVAMRHGVSRIRSGERYTLGIIFHDAA